MTKRALRGAKKTSIAFVVSAALFMAGMAATTLGYFDGQTDNAGTFPAGYVFPPVTVTTLGGVTGPVQTIKWSQLTTTGVNFYELRGTNMGTTAATCPTQTTIVTEPTTTVGSPPTATQNGVSTIAQPQTYPETVGTIAAPVSTAAATIPSTDNGSFMCYQVAAAQTLPGGFYSPPVNANATAVRAGLWASAVVNADAGGASHSVGVLTNLDSITITYNQNVTASGTVTVCSFTSGVVLIGDPGCGAATDSFSVGKLTGLTVGQNKTYTGTISSPSSTSIKITVGLPTNTTTANTVSGSGTWANGGTVVKAGTLSPCTQAACNVTPSGGF